MPTRALLLSAGGIASTVLAYWLHQRGTGTAMVSCRFDRHGHGAVAAARTAELLRYDHQVVDLSELVTLTGDHDEASQIRTTDPTAAERRAHLVAAVGNLASTVAPGPDLPVLVGAHADDLVGGPCSQAPVHAPLAELPVAAVIALGQDLGVRWHDTRSCLRAAQATHCGRCTGCRRRRGAFAAANVVDPIEPAALSEDDR